MAKILIVEDYQKVGELIKSKLEEKAHSVDLVFDGEEGYKKIVEGQFDLVLLDLQLPKMSGLDILKKLHENGIINTGGKIVVLTTVGEEKAIDEAKTYGASGGIVKSTTNQEVIIEEVGKYL